VGERLQPAEQIMKMCWRAVQSGIAPTLPVTAHYPVRGIVVKSEMLINRVEKNISNI
jgi:hypothetical protein